MKEHITNALTEARTCLDNFLGDEMAIANIEKAASIMINSIKSQGKIFSCGNGGSMCDAMHFAEELSGRYRDSRRGLPAISISDASHLTCVANDFGYDEVFARYLQAHGHANDTLLAISTSGTSRNVVKAAEYARENNINVIALTGKQNSTLGKLANIEIATPESDYADRSQEIHIKIIHIFMELIERDMFPENY